MWMPHNTFDAEPKVIQAITWYGQVAIQYAISVVKRRH